MISEKKIKFILVTINAMLFCFMTIYCSIKMRKQRKKKKKKIKILEAYTFVIASIEMKNYATIHSIVINNSNSQTQNQKQNVEVLVKYIEDAFTLSQLREISQIVNAEDGNMENARPKIIEKIKSFGKNLAPSIVANIITNPSVWASVFGR